MESPIGRVLGNGRYRIEGLLGKGGQGAVYRGTHLTLNAPIAIKVLTELSGDNRTAKSRFRREAERSAQLKHPNIVVVHDFSFEDGIYYIVNEFIQGCDLKEHCKRVGRPLTLEEAWPIIEQVGHALDYAHKQGMVHRDVKPANVLLDQINSRAVLCDFGLARMQENEDITVSAQVGSSLGTPLYMSPEQCLGSVVDQRTDLYSFALVVYELLCGKHPLQGPNDTRNTMLYKQVHEPPPDPRSINPAITKAQASALMKALAKNPDDRFATIGEFLHALQHGNSSGPHWLVIGAVALVIAALAITGWLLFRPIDTGPDPTALPPVTSEADIKATITMTPSVTPSPVKQATTRIAPDVQPPELVTPLEGEELSGSQVTLSWIASQTLANDQMYLAELWSPSGERSHKITASRFVEVTLDAAGEYQWRVSIVAMQGSEFTSLADSEPRRLLKLAAPTETYTPEPEPATAVAPRPTTPMPTGTPVPRNATIVITGLDTWGLDCSTLIFFDKADGVVSRQSLAGTGGTVSAPSGASWLKFEGGPGGTCPWDKYNAVGDPNEVKIVGESVELEFTKKPSGGGGDGSSKSPTDAPWW